MRSIVLILLTLTIKITVAQTPAIDSLKQIIALQKHDTVEFEVLLNLTYEFMRRDLTRARQYSFEIVKHANATTQAKWLSGAYNYLITIYQQTGKADSALYTIELFEKLVKQNTDNKKIVYNYNQATGLFYKNRGEYKKALPYMVDNLRLWTKPDENRAGLLLNLGNLFQEVTFEDYYPLE